MSKHNEKHDHSHHHQGSHSPKKGIHRDWRLWVAVILMLAAMFAYVATIDEAVQPGGQVGEEVPAMAE